MFTILHEIFFGGSLTSSPPCWFRMSNWQFEAFVKRKRRFSKYSTPLSCLMHLNLLLGFENSILSFCFWQQEYGEQIFLPIENPHRVSKRRRNFNNSFLLWWLPHRWIFEEKDISGQRSRASNNVITDNYAIRTCPLLKFCGNVSMNTCCCQFITQRYHTSTTKRLWVFPESTPVPNPYWLFDS